MLKRKVYDRLLEWKADRDGKCLLLRGARQVGKTFIVEQFGTNEYESFIEINFMLDPRFKSVFEKTLDVSEITANISLFVPGSRLIPGRTLIFFDEIQECPRARTALKSFALDGRFDVIASGSLLGLHYKVQEDHPIPVGYEKEVVMNSLDFEEFLWAIGVDESFTAELRASIADRKPLGEARLSVFSSAFRKFMVIGGMPDAVMTFLRTNNYWETWEVNRSILSSYADDVERYVRGVDRNKTRACLTSIPAQLSKSNRKFMYADIDGDTKNGVRKYEGNLRWLIDTEIVVPCHNLNEPRAPLEGMTNITSFKVYMHDTGLLLASYDYSVLEMVMTGDNTLNAGAIMENSIAGCILRAGKVPYYFERRGRLEIDFVTYTSAGVTAIEVKSGFNHRVSSLDKLDGLGYRVDLKVKLEEGDIAYDGNVLHLPLFAAAFLDSI